MKTKMIMGVSLAVALGASAFGTALVCKPPLINNTVYAKGLSTTQKVEKENITIYMPNKNLINSKNLATADHNGKKYIPMTFSTETGKLIPIASYMVKTANTNIKDTISLGEATIKKCSNPADITNSKGEVFNMPCIKENINIPVGTKLKVLWTGKSIVSYNNKTHKVKLANIAAIDYNGELAFVSDNYLNMTNVATGEKAMQIVSKNKLKDIHYIGTSKVIIPFGPTIDPLTYKPTPLDMTVPVNGTNYRINILGKTVNVINYGNPYVHDDLKSNETIGPMFGPYSKIEEPKYAKVEYNGMIGYVLPMSLSNSPYLN